jgi:hypothetical protein
LHAGAALDGMDCIPQHQAQKRTDPRDGASPGERVGITRLGRGEDSQCHVTEPVVVVPKQRQLDCDALLHRGIGKPRGHAVAGGLRDHLVPDLAPVVLTVGVLDMGESLCAFAHEVDPAPEEITGCAHLGRGDVRLWEHAPTQAQRDVLGIDSVVVGFAALDGYHVEGMSEDEGNTLPSTQVSQPGPREETFHAHDEVLQIRSDGLEKRFGSCLHRAVQHDLSVLMQDTEVHGVGVQVDATIKLVWLSGELPEVSSSPEVVFPSPSRPRRYAEEGA